MPVPCARPEVAAAENVLTDPNRTRIRRARAGWLALALAGALVVAGCGNKVEKAPEVRPVRLAQLQPATGKTSFEFSGDVRPRVESRLGFRVGGKIAARLVDVGASVKKGQPLARLDATDLSLAEAGSRAQYDAAKTDRDLAASDLKRYNDLFAKGFISAAEQHRRQATFDAAESRLQQAAAGLRNQSNQTGYAVLMADADGVVTGVDAEVGQVVTAGQPVIRVAQTAEKEIAIGLPEDQVDMLRGIPDVTIHTWAEPERILPGRVREISAAADPVTRTYATRVTVPNPPADLKIGMTAVVRFVRSGETPAIRVPLTAILQEQGRNIIWVYEKAAAAASAPNGAAGTVRPVQVTLGDPIGNEVEVRQGLSPGQTIVTAGVHLLKAGQQVRPMQTVAPSPTASPSGSSGPQPANQKG